MQILVLEMAAMELQVLFLVQAHHPFTLVEVVVVLTPVRHLLQEERVAQVAGAQEEMGLLDKPQEHKEL